MAERVFRTCICMNVGVHISARSVSGAVLCVQVYKQMMKRVWGLPTKLVTPGVWIGDSRGPWHKSDAPHVLGAGASGVKWTEPPAGFPCNLFHVS